MKHHFKHLTLLAVLGLGTSVSFAQNDLLDAVNNALDGGANIADLPELPQPGEAAGDPDDLGGAGELPAIGGDLPAVDAPADDLAAGADAAPFAPLEDQKREMEETSEGYIIKDAGLNDIFQFLAKSAGRQYFHNLKINGPDYVVTGHLDDGNPLNQMEELAFMYGLSLHTKGNTIYALTQAQLGQLPSSEFHYQLKYLRPSDMEQIKELLRPMLTPGTGIVNFEPKTNTVIIIDTATRIEAVQNLLHGIDKAKGQIIVETKILRINSTAGQKIGVNWADNLGTAGVGVNVAGQLADVFGLPSSLPGAFGGENIVLSPVELTGLLRALNEGGISNQVSNPTLITEDNEQATISIIDRIPIITSTTTVGGPGTPTTFTDEVRYKIDSSDKAITEDPDNHREIGISIAVTPTLLPDGTVRMKMRPRSAQIVDEVVGLTGNRYPRVTESMVETMARIPDGCSLIVGGFYGEIQSKDRNKVPLLGDIPLLNFFFKSKEASKEQTSLVFIVTPTSYDPTNTSANNNASRTLKRKTELPGDFDWVDPYNPGPAHEPNLKRTIRGMEPTEAPYYPREDEFRVRQNVSRQAAPEVERTEPRFSRARRR